MHIYIISSAIRAQTNLPIQGGSKGKGCRPQAWGTMAGILANPHHPEPWNVIMARGGFTANDSIVIKEIVDMQLDTIIGSIPGEEGGDGFLRKEMDMQKLVFPTYDVYELWFWSFEEDSPNLLNILRKAVVARAAADGQMQMRIIAQAVAMKMKGA